MIGIDQFRDICEIVEDFEVRPLRITIPMSITAEDIDSPSIIHQACTKAERGSLIAIISERLRDTPSLFRFYAFSYDVDCATNRRGTEFGCANTSLNLHNRRNFTQACPVRPIHRAILHIINGNAIYQSSHISIVKATDKYL